MDERAIYKIQSQQLPQFRFEWHPRGRKVYVVRVGALPEVAELIADNIDNHGAAINATLLWCRGYHACRLEREAGVLVTT